jgi:hypothetical protein
MKYSFLFVILLLAGIASAYAQDTIEIDESDISEIPKGIRYIEAGQEQNKNALNSIVKLLKGDPDRHEKLSNMLILGPHIWTYLDAFDIVTSDSLVQRTLFSFPHKDGTVQQGEGAVVMGEEMIYSLMIILDVLWVNQPSYEIRKLKPDELNYYWFICSWDLSEPLYYVHTGLREFIFDFDDDGDLFFLEDVTDMPHNLQYRW